MSFSGYFTPEVWSYVIIPILIILARICDVSIGTMRIIFVSKGLKHIAPVLGFFEVLIWLLAIGQIMQNLTSVLNYIAYAIGFALGTFFGIQIEHKLAMGISMIRVITVKEASELIEKLRSNGLVVTSVDAEGNRGAVKVFFTIVNRKEQKPVLDLIRQYNPNAFYTIEDIGFVHRSAIPATTQRRKLFKFLDLKRR